MPYVKPSLPPPTLSASSDPKIRVDYYRIPEAIKSKLSNADIAAYKAIVSAYMNYESTVSYSANDELISLWELVELCFPLFYADIDDSSVKYEDGVISWEYTVDKETHHKLITEFESIVLGYINLAEMDGRTAASDIMKALIIYKQFCEDINYDYPSQSHFHGEIILSEQEYLNHSYDALSSGRGVCWCYARGYAFLLNQIGIDALTVCADGRNGHHEWTLFKFDNAWFFADPTWDMDGTHLNYFGITAKAREADGYFIRDMQYFAGGTFPFEDEFNVSDNRFVGIYSGAYYHDYYDLDPENNRIIFYRYNIFGSLTVSQTLSLDFD